MEHEREIREELEEIAKNPQAEVWLSLIQQNNTPIHATLRLSSIVCRALSKKLLFNNSLRSLNLSRNGLNDMAGKHLAAMLRRNTTLERLELEGNSLGPSTARELGDALSQNESLLYLNLESNPLTDEEKDFSGIAALGDMLGKNSTLRTLILWRTRLGGEGAKYLAAGLEKNDSIICLDIGNNRIGTAAAVKMDTKLVQNRMKFEKEQEKKVAVRKAQLLAAEKDQKRRDEQKKKEEHVRVF
jgi:Ran GTPase-activating protein (RanGAP) involved in mRNA processing and transport